MKQNTKIIGRFHALVLLLMFVSGCDSPIRPTLPPTLPQFDQIASIRVYFDDGTFAPFDVHNGDWEELLETLGSASRDDQSDYKWQHDGRVVIRTKSGEEVRINYSSEGFEIRDGSSIVRYNFTERDATKNRAIEIRQKKERRDSSIDLIR